MSYVTSIQKHNDRFPPHIYTTWFKQLFYFPRSIDIAIPSIAAFLADLTVFSQNPYDLGKRRGARLSSNTRF